MKIENIITPNGNVDLHYEDVGTGKCYLLLHGGAGAASMRPILERLKTTGRVILPSHPGFDGTTRPDWFSSASDIAHAYAELIASLGLESVTIIGNSFGGWLGAEIALLAPERSNMLVLLDAIGLRPDDLTGPIADPLKLGAEVLNYSFYDPERFKAILHAPENAERTQNNQRTLAIYAGDPFMYSPDLKERLKGIHTPTVVLWGESDRIVSVKYGQAMAEAIPNAVFFIIEKAGHFPQLENLDKVMEFIE